MIRLVVNLTFLEKIKSGDFLTFFAVVLAYLAYSKSINDKYESWRSLLLSLKADLESQSAWLSSEYKEETYKDKTAFSPRKIIFPLSFKSLEEIISRGASDFNFSEKFIKNISIFDERIETFNKLLEQQRLNVTANPVLTHNLVEILDSNGACDCATTYDNFFQSIENMKVSQPDCYALAKRIHSINRIIHINIISNEDDESGLHYLYKYLLNEVQNKLSNLEKSKPWHLRYKWPLLILGCVLFILIESLLK